MRRIQLTLAATGLMITAPLYAQAPAAELSTVEMAVASTSRSDENRALDESRMPAEVLAFAGIESGDSVADFMAGGGYYTELIAAIVGERGKVYALNPSGFHNAEAWAALSATHANIVPAPNDPKEMLIEENSVDTIFSHLVFHDLYWESEQYNFLRLDVEMMLANWFAGVKPGGSVIVVDHAGPAGDPREVTAKFHRIDPARVIADMTKAGFEFEARSGMLRRSEDDQSKNVFDPAIRGKTDRFVMKFRKKSED